MKKLLLRVYVLLLILIVTRNGAVQAASNDEHDIRKFLCTEYETQATQLCHKQAQADWDHSLDVTNVAKANAAISAAIKTAAFERQVYDLFIKDINVQELDNHDIARQVKKLNNIGYSALRPGMLQELTKILSDMQNIYSSAKICPYASPRCDVEVSGIPLTPDIENIMGDSIDYDELLYTWIAWHDATGAKIRAPFEYYVVLANAAAVANNFSDKGEMWRNEFETDNFEEMVDDLWEQVEPLYVELQTFTRYRLREVFHKEMDQEDDGLIPAHLLGNMWAQNWLNLKDLLIPYPNDTMVDLGEVFQQKNISVLKMFQMANDFYKSMGLLPMDDAYNVGKGVMIEKPRDGRVVSCHASAWDFCTGQDFRIKMCAHSTLDDFITIHHELGHIQYYMLYKQQPILYRDGANPSFHEAIGDMLALSVINPKHFQRLNLLPTQKLNAHNTVNMLMNMALVKVAFLPFGYLLDKWRWDIFAEKIDPEKWNDHFWNYRMKYQRVKAPIVRTHEDFDAGGKFHVSADSQYISYFLANILEFQIHKAMCKVRSMESSVDEEEPLYFCDLHGNRIVGMKLKHALKMGASRHWTYVLRDLTGQSRISAHALLEYFEPLSKFLKHANNAYNKKLHD